MKNIVNIGYIGLGRRGISVLRECFSQMKDVKISAICDKSAARMERAVEIVKEKSGSVPRMVMDYHEILADPTIDAVIIMIGWSGRPGVAMESMRAGKYTAIEVGCADTLQECFDLVQTYEETKTPVMMLENCCYGRREMMLLNMVKQGLFGEVVHCTGGYMHYLNEAELFKNIDQEEIPHYRLEQYIRRNRENYPTHELGPISKILNINRGNRMVRLSSIASKSCGLKDYAARKFGSDSPYAQIDYKQGDVVNTIITCEGGETISLTLDTTLPRAYYSRNISVRGTNGMSIEDTETVYIVDKIGEEAEVKNNEKEIMEKYDHPLHKEYIECGSRGGHGGMDWLVCRAFVESVKNGTNTPIDAYDAATWLSIGCLSEQSIANGGAPVEIPDFTNGKWNDREPITRGKYCLDAVCEDPQTKIF